LATGHPADSSQSAHLRQSQEWEVSFADTLYPDARYSDAKEQVRQATDIVDLVGKHLELRRAGRGYVGRCPWHDDRRPSLQVNPDRQTWKCWVCDIGGDVFSFVMKREGCDFRDALKMLAERAGITLAGPQKKAEPGSPDDKHTLYQCCEWAARQFHECLLRSPGAEAARQYVEERQITPASVERFVVGYSPSDWSWLLGRAQNSPYSTKVLEAVGLVGKSERGSCYDRFRGRLIFPIRDTQGRTIAFGGRILPGAAEQNAAKYVNSPETRLYTKSDTLYALDIVRNRITKSRQLTVVEGYTDVILCHQHGVDDVVACCGTALNERHIRLIKRFADTVYLVLDGDAAGQNRTNDILELFVAAQMDLRILTLPEELDPAQFMQERGGEAFRELLVTAVDALEHKIRTATRGVDLARDTHRANLALESILQTIAQGVSGGAIDATGLRAQQLLARLARQFALEEADVRARFGQLRRRTEPSRAPSSEHSVPGTQYSVQSTDGETGRGDESMSLSFRALPAADGELLEILVLHPELAPTALTDIGDEDLASPAGRQIFQTYRQLEEGGFALDFHAVMSQIEDSQLKHLLVEIDDAAQAKSPKAILDGPSRLRSVIRQFHQRHELRELRQTEAALEQRAFNEQEELNVLASMIAAKRRQQGIAAPMDG
jgi:DNA primase